LLPCLTCSGLDEFQLVGQAHERRNPDETVSQEVQTDDTEATHTDNMIPSCSAETTSDSSMPSWVKMLMQETKTLLESQQKET